LLIIAVSFLPILALQQESGRLFAPLAYTKTFSIVVAAALGVTIVPALMVLLIRRRAGVRRRSPVNGLLERAYQPIFDRALRRPVVTLVVAILVACSALWPLSRIGAEFMPRLDEGDLLYMPTTAPSIGLAKSRELLQQSDKLLAMVPEVKSVHGKMGRADTATDPAPLSMIETTIQLEIERERWRRRKFDRFFATWPEPLRTGLAWLWPLERPITLEELKHGWRDGDGTEHAGLDEVVRLPGLVNAWTFPIEGRITMLSTGIKTPVGMKIQGPRLEVLEELARRTAAVVRTVRGTSSAVAEETLSGYYRVVDYDRSAIARAGLAVQDVADALAAATGGLRVGQCTIDAITVPITIRQTPMFERDPHGLDDVVVRSSAGLQMSLAQLACVRTEPGPVMIRSENAQPTVCVYIDIHDRDLNGYVAEARKAVDDAVPLPAGYSRVWSGTFEHLEDARRRLLGIVPATLFLIVLLLYLGTRSWLRVCLILVSVPFSLVGALWFLWLLDYEMSLAVWVGVIALLGIDAETGQMMLLYLDSSYRDAKNRGAMTSRADLYRAIQEGAVQRLRPKAMTVATDMIGLLPLLWVTGTGAEVTRRIVAPLIGGIWVSFAIELLVYPVVYWLFRARQLRLAPAGLGIPG
jgi:Cu(I)/Ag(I) efflux system membrane protein CusA/SilA